MFFHIAAGVRLLQLEVFSVVYTTSLLHAEHRLQCLLSHDIVLLSGAFLSFSLLNCQLEGLVHASVSDHMF